MTCAHPNNVKLAMVSYSTKQRPQQLLPWLDVTLITLKRLNTIHVKVVCSFGLCGCVYQQNAVHTKLALLIMQTLKMNIKMNLVDNFGRLDLVFYGIAFGRGGEGNMVDSRRSAIFIIPWKHSYFAKA